MEQPQRPQMTLYSACTLNAGYLRLETYVQTILYFLLSTATTVMQTHLNVTLHVHCLYYCISLGDIQLIAILLPIAKWDIWSYFKCSLNRSRASPFLNAKFGWQQVQNGGDVPTLNIQHLIWQKKFWQSFLKSVAQFRYWGTWTFFIG